MTYSMALSELISALNIESEDQTLIKDLAIDSRRVSKGSAFIAYPGTLNDGRSYIQSAQESGASAILYERLNLDGQEYELPEGISVPTIAVDNLRAYVGNLAHHFFKEPSSDIQVFGITGTNGKTTCCYLLTQALAGLGMRVAMIGTIGVGQLHSLVDSGHTTPDPISVHRLLALWRDQDVTQVCMEVSSHALDQDRIGGVQFFCTLFTNLSHDHLDYHGDMKSYADAKIKLFTDYGSELVITNADDEIGADLINIANSEFIASFGEKGDVCLKSRELLESGMTLLIEAGDAAFKVDTSLIGKVNIPNILLLVATLLSLSISVEEIQRVVHQVRSAPGRMELYKASSKSSVVVDYAHTPDALERALHSIIEHCRGRLLCVFGCGGDRDIAKRPLMGEIATRLADHVILTNDNPRSEKPEEIIADIKVGILNKESPNLEIIQDRKKAISSAIAQANDDDWILIAGKGHEKTQTIGSQVLKFSDREIVAEILGVAV